MSAARVTLLINSLSQGGAERQALELIQHLDRRRYLPSLITCTRVDDLPYDLETVEHRRIASPLALGQLIAATRSLRTDVLHTYLGLSNLAGRLAGHRAAPVVISSVRNTQLPRRFIWSDRLTHPWGDGIIVNSRGIRDELMRRAKVPAASITVVENGVDLHRFAPTPAASRAALRAERGVGDGLLLLLPGRLSRQKNQFALLGAMRRLLEAGRWPSGAKVWFAGRGSPPWVGHATRLHAAALRLGPHIEFLGTVRDIETLYALADAVLLPSRHEGLPNAVLESMACGVPAVVSPAANIDGLVRDGREGLVLEGTDEAAIMRGLDRLFGLRPEQRQAMGARGREHAQRRFSVARMVERTMAVYDRARGLPPSPRGSIDAITAP